MEGLKPVCATQIICLRKREGWGSKRCVGGLRLLNPSILRKVLRHWATVRLMTYSIPVDKFSKISSVSLDVLDCLIGHKIVS